MTRRHRIWVVTVIAVAAAILGAQVPCQAQNGQQEQGLVDAVKAFSQATDKLKQELETKNLWPSAQAPQGVTTEEDQPAAQPVRRSAGMRVVGRVETAEVIGGFTKDGKVILVDPTTRKARELDYIGEPGPDKVIGAFTTDKKVVLVDKGADLQDIESVVVQERERLNKVAADVDKLSKDFYGDPNDPSDDTPERLKVTEKKLDELVRPGDDKTPAGTVVKHGKRLDSVEQRLDGVGKTLAAAAAKADGAHTLSRWVSVGVGVLLLVVFGPLVWRILHRLTRRTTT